MGGIRARTTGVVAASAASGSGAHRRTPADHISSGLAVVVLVFAVLMVTSFQGRFIATMTTIVRFG